MPQGNNKINFSLNFQKGDTAALDSLKKDLIELKRLAGDADFGLDPKSAQQLTASVNMIEQAMSKATDFNLNTINVQKFNNILKQSGTSIKQLQEGLSLAGAEGNAAFLKMTAQLMQFNTATKQTHKFLDSMATTLFNTIKWTVTSNLLNNFIGGIEKAYYYTKDLDRSLNDIRIVTGKSADEMSKFADEANKAAKELAVTTEDYTTGALIYYQQGLDDETVKTLTDITAKTSNVTQQSMGTVSEQLTAVWNGYKVANEAAEEGMQVYEEYVDKMAAVGASTASDLEELSTAMSKVASAASNMGVTFDDLNAQIATIVSVTRQAPESVGTALKTIYARLGDLKVDGVDEFGTKLGEVSSQLKTMGIDILDTNGDMRDMSSVMAEVADKWNTWSSAQQQAAAIAMAGKRQYNNLVALFENWDMYGEALETSMSAAGTLEKQQEIALDSLANKMDILSATSQGLYQSLIDEDTIKGFVEGLTSIVDLLKNFSDAVGGLSNLLPLLGATAFRVFNQQIADGLSKVIINMQIAKTEQETMLSNQQALQQMFSESSLFQQSGSSAVDTARASSLQQLTGFYGKMVQYQSIMTQEEKEQYNTILNKLVKVGELNGQLAEEGEYYNTFSNKLNIIDNEIMSKIISNTKLEVNELAKVSKEINTINQITESMDMYGNLGKQNWTDYLHQLKELGVELDLDSDIIKRIDKEFAKLKDTSLSFAEKLKIVSNELKSTSSRTQSLVQMRTEMDNLKNSAEQAGNSLKNNLNIELQIANITKMVGAIGQLAMGINTLKNLGSVWNNEDIELGDKVLQTTMSLSMAYSMLISPIKEIISLTVIKNNQDAINLARQTASLALETKEAVRKAATIALEGIRNKQRQDEIKDIATLITEKQLDSIITNKGTTGLIAQSIAKKAGITLNEKELASLKTLLIAKAADRDATLKQAAAHKALTTAILSSPITWLVAGLAAVALVAGTYIKAQEKMLENQIEQNKKTIEQVNEIQKEVDENKKLCTSYEELYAQYKNHKVEKEALYEITDQLCDQYNIENGYLAALSGNYDEVTRAVREARDAELEYAKAQTEKEITASQENLLGIARGGVKDLGYLFGNKYNISFASGATDPYYEKIEPLLREAGLASGFASINADDPAAMVDLYEKAELAITKLRVSLSETQRASSATYQNLTDWVARMEPAITQYREALDDSDRYLIEQIANKYNLAGAQSLQEFETEAEKFSEELAKTNLNTADSIEDIVKTYIKALNTEYSRTKLGIDELKKQVDQETIDYINSLTESQKEFLLSGKVDLTFVYNKKQLQDEMQLAYNDLGTFDVTSPISLADTLVSGKKLKKADNEILKGLQNENTPAMEGFDQKSTLSQLDVIDEITQHRIEKNQEYLTKFEESIEEQKRIKEDELNSIFKTEEEYNRARYARDTTRDEEEKKAIQEKIDKYETLLGIVDDLNSKLEEGLSFGEIEDIGFSDLISGIDLVIDRSEALQNAAELIGEGFTVAASDVEKLANIFPELLENAKALDDGSLQLDKDLTKEKIESIKTEMEARNQAKIAEVDQQIALKELEQEYLQSKLKSLEAYLQGKQSEQRTIDQINQAGFDYETGLMKLTGQEITTLTDHAIASSVSEGTALIDMLNAVGEGFSQAANAHYAMLHGEKVEWSHLDFSGTASSAQAYASSVGEEALDLYNKNFYMYEQIYEEAQQVQDQLNLVTGELDELNAKKAILESTGKASLHALDNVAKGKGGKDSKSGGSKKKDKEQKKLEDEFDRYWDIKKAIDAVETALSRLDKKQEKLYGKELIKSLKIENQLLEQQAADYEALAAAQREEASELQGVLAGHGMTFDASGAITNYAAATSAALAEYNNAIAQYNAGLLDESALHVYEKNYEAFKKALQRYDTLYYTEMKNTQDKLEEIRRKQLENNLKAWEVEIQLKLDMRELERQWNDFIRDVTKDFQKVYDDLRVGLKTMLKDASTYLGEEGTIGTIIDAVHDVTHEIDLLESGNASSMFESISQAQEKLKELNDQLLDGAKALHDLWEEAWDSYLDGIDQVSDKFEDLMDRFEKIDDELEFQKQIIELLYGEEAYGLMNKLFSGQEHNLEAQLESLKQQKDMWEDLFYASGATLENQADWTADQQKYYERWTEAQGKLNDAVIEYIKLLKDDYLNTVKDVVKQFEMMVTNGSGLDYLGDQWDRISDRADKYFDSVEKAYKIQQLANKMDEDINKMSNLKNQQKLQALREKEIDYLREKETLTQYDLDAAEARYQIALKEAALEDARNNKTSMKLTRNEQGNWSYQYVADEEDIASKRQELLDAYGDLYQLASDAYEANLEALLDLQQTYLNKAQEIYENEVLSEEQKQQQLSDLRHWYLDEYKLLAEENALYRDDLTVASSALLLEVYRQDQDAYESMTDYEKELLDTLLSSHIDGFMDLEEKVKDNYNNIGDKAKEVMSDTRADWRSGAQEIADLWNRNSGWSVKVQVTQAYTAIEQANQRYKDKVDWCADAVERDFSEQGISGAIMRAENETDNLRDKTVDMVITSIAYLNELRAYVDQIAAAWMSVQQEIMNAISLIEAYLRKVGEANAAAQQAIASRNVAAAKQAAAANSRNGNGLQNGTSSDSKTRDTSFYTNPKSGNVHYELYGNGSSFGLGLVQTNQQSEADANYEDYLIKRYGPGFTASTLATGGYTGSWDDSGRLAVLHQKELVLNADDTKNFLSGIQMIRDMSGINGSIEKAIARSVINMASGLTAGKAGTGFSGTTNNSSENNTFNITAEFPNANNVDDIRQAILTLPNIASQYINKSII